MPGDADRFGRELDRAADEVIAQAIEFHKTCAQTVFAMLVSDSRTVGLTFGSPVWSGRYRGSFTIAINQIDHTYKPPNPKADPPYWPKEVLGKYSPLAASDVRRKIERLRLGDVVYIANSLPYVRRIEFGHSKLKAPNGVFEVTVAAAEGKLQAQAHQIAIVVNKG